MSTPMIDPFAQAIPEAAREQYWNAVESALMKIFGIKAEIARKITDDYRVIVDNSPIGEQVAVYHYSPYNIALDLARRASEDRRWTDVGLPDSEALDQMYEDFANRQASQ